MSRIDNLEKLVRELYEARDLNRAADWADWLYDNHVFVVADNATRLAKQLNANEELSRAAGMLHDIADVRFQHLPRGLPRGDSGGGESEGNRRFLSDIITVS